MKPATSKFYESEVCEEEQQAATCTTYDVNKWLDSQPQGLLFQDMISEFNG